MADLDLAIRVRADLQSALNGINKLTGATDDTGKAMRRASSAGESFGSAVRRLVVGDLLARGITAIARSARQFAGDVVRAGVASQSLTLAMRAVTADAAAAARALAFVDTEADRLGLDLATAERAFIQLTAAARGTALEGQATRDVFSAIAEASRALGLGAAQQAGALTAIEQIISKGTVSAEELRGQLGERLPGAFQIAARAIGVTTAELDRMLQRGEVAAESFLPRFAAELRRTFGAGAERAAQGPAAAFVRMNSEFEKLRRNVANSSGVTTFLGDLAGDLAEIARNANIDLQVALADPGTAERLQEASDALGDLLRYMVEHADTLLTVSGALAGIAAGARIGGLKGAVALGLGGAYLGSRIIEDVESVEELEQALQRLREAQARIADRGSIVSRALGSGLDTSRASAAIEAEIQEVERRLAAAQARAADRLRRLTLSTLDEELTGTYDLPGRPPPPAETPAQPITSDAAATTALEHLRQQIEATRDLSHEEQVLADVQSGRLGSVAAADAAALVRAARQLDVIEARRRGEEEAAEAAEAQRRALEDVHATALADAQRIEDAQRRAAELTAGYARELAGLEGPYAAARHAAEEWRRAQLAAVEDLDVEQEVIDRLKATIEQLTQARRDDADAAEQARQGAAAQAALRDATDIGSGITRALQDLGTELDDFSRLAYDATTNAFRGIEDALVRLVSTGKLEFSSLAESIIADLARIAIRQQVTLPLFNWFEGLFPSAGSGFPAVPTTHSGGIAGAQTTFRTGVPAAAFAGAPRLHAGGVAGLRPNEIPTILERGEGVFTREQMRALGAGAGPRSIEVRIDNRGAAPQEVQQATPRIDGERLILDVVTGDIARGGRIPRVLAAQGA